MRVDVHGAVHAVVGGQLHQAADHTVVVGAVAVLGADGHLILRAGQVLADAAHVHGQQLVHLRQGGAAVAHPLVHGKADAGVVPRALAGVVHTPEQGQQAGRAGLVVQEAGLDEPALGDDRLGVVAHVVAGGDAQRLHILPAADLLVDTHCHVLLVPGAGGGIVLHMRRRREREHRAGEHLSRAGIDAAVLAVQRGHQRAAHPGDHQHAAVAY